MDQGEGRKRRDQEDFSLCTLYTGQSLLTEISGHYARVEPCVSRNLCRHERNQFVAVALGGQTEHRKLRGKRQFFRIGSRTEILNYFARALINEFRTFIVEAITLAILTGHL